MALIDPKCYDNEHSDVDIMQLSKGARLDLSWFIVTHGHQSRNRELALSYLLIRQGRYQATDARDKVYALLSMVHDAQADGLVVDYDLPTAEVYTMAMKEMVLLEKKLGVLCVCSRKCRQQDSLAQLPSWCPDFSTDPTDRCCPARLWSYTKTIYYASGSLNAKARFLQERGRAVLSARGWRLDTISVLPHNREHGTKGFLSLKCLLFLAQGIEEERPEDLKSISAAAHEAIWRTLVANRGHSHDEAPKEFEDWYEMLVAKYTKPTLSLRLRSLCSKLLSVQPINSFVNELKRLLSPMFFAFASAWTLTGLSRLSRYLQLYSQASNVDVDVDDVTVPFKQKMDTCLRKRLLCKSQIRAIPGLAPETAKDGDIISILVGCALPMILRKVEDHYIVIGESYIHGFMCGEILDIAKRGEVDQEDFLIY